MRHLFEVRKLDSKRSRWVAAIPGGLGTISWDADMTVSDDRIYWKSLPESALDNSGELLFRDAPAGGGTEVQAWISYRPPAGEVGRAVSKLLTPVFEQMVHEDIRRFKHLMEAGEIPTTEGQPSGRF